MLTCPCLVLRLVLEGETAAAAPAVRVATVQVVAPDAATLALATARNLAGNT